MKQQDENLSAENSNPSGQEENTSRTQQGGQTAPGQKVSHDDPGAQQESPPLPEINFAAFVMSLSSSAFIHFGDIPDPVTSQKQTNLSFAKQTIDILGMLKQKTVGNLSREESQLLESLLYDLRMRYVEETKKIRH